MKDVIQYSYHYDEQPECRLGVVYGKCGIQEKAEKTDQQPIIHYTYIVCF